jgi:hypothetical protein
MRTIHVAGMIAFSLGIAAAQVKEQVVDFEKAVPIVAGDKANRVAEWAENGVTFTLARAPQRSKGKGLLMFFTHLGSGRKGIVSALANEPIPVRATFAQPVSSVTVAFWGSTVTPALLQAFDGAGQVIHRASLDATPRRKSPGDPAPVFTLTVQAPQIAYVEFSGPREGEYLAADEVRFTPVSKP